MKVIAPSPYKNREQQEHLVTCRFCKAELFFTSKDIQINYHPGYSDMRESWNSYYSCKINCPECGKDTAINDFGDDDFLSYLYEQKGEWG